MNDSRTKESKGLQLIIQSVHFVVALYYVLTPLIATNVTVLRDYVILSAFLWLHWFTNNDTCALTMLECWVCDLPESETFFGKLVKPVYNITSYHIYFAHFTLVGIAVAKIIYTKVNG